MTKSESPTNMRARRKEKKELSLFKANTKPAADLAARPHLTNHLLMLHSFVAISIHLLIKISDKFVKKVDKAMVMRGKRMAGDKIIEKLAPQTANFDVG